VIFLKLGGSLITDKAKPETCRTETLERLAREIADAKQRNPGLRLLLGHGSGSFGHYVAARYGTHLGASTAQDWTGFSQVWHAAQRLNRLVVDAMQSVGLPVVAFPPSASAIAEAGTIQHIAVEPLKRALDGGLIPIVYGDVAFDREKGACILSTENIFAFLAESLNPNRILLAGTEPGVYVDFPTSARIMSVVTQQNLAEASLAGATNTDVTGGMRAKVEAALALTLVQPGVEVRIFSGEQAGLITSSLLGGTPGTLISALTD
jgi:isopentenyl phosphate kinase